VDAEADIDDDPAQPAANSAIQARSGHHPLELTEPKSISTLTTGTLASVENYMPPFLGSATLDGQPGSTRPIPVRLHLRCRRHRPNFRAESRPPANSMLIGPQANGANHQNAGRRIVCPRDRSPRLATGHPASSSKLGVPKGFASKAL